MPASAAGATGPVPVAGPVESGAGSARAGREAPRGGLPVRAAGAPPPLAPQEVDRLARRAAGGDAAARERLVTANLNLVRHVVRRFLGGGRDADELFQVGCLGLVKAVDRFDPDRGFRFSTYAVPLILGEVRRHLRDAAGGGPRGAARVARAAREAERRLAARRGRQPSMAEVAAELGLSPGELAVALEAARPPASLEAAGAHEAGDRPLLARLAGTAGPDAPADRAALRALVARLPERQRRLLVLRFYLDRTQAEAAAALGLSQPQVSRLERSALEALRREWLAGPGSGSPAGSAGGRRAPPPAAAPGGCAPDGAATVAPPPPEAAPGPR